MCFLQRKVCLCAQCLFIWRLLLPLIEVKTGKESKIRVMTCSPGPQVGVKPITVAEDLLH